MYEVSPDYGMIAQAWNIYAVAVPLVNHFFGIDPQAYDEHITIRPRMPTGWDDAELENLPVGDNVITFEKATQNGTVSYTIHQTQSHWTIAFSLPEDDDGVIEVNGTTVEPQVVGNERVLSLTGAHNEIEIAPR